MYCGYGENEPINFDLWRQLSVEHIISTTKGGRLTDIRKAIRLRFPNLPKENAENVTKQIDAMNTITVCRLCNSLTCRWPDETNLVELIINSSKDMVETLNMIEMEIKRIRKEKKKKVEWKLKAIRSAFENKIKPELCHDS